MAFSGTAEKFRKLPKKAEYGVRSAILIVERETSHEIVGGFLEVYNEMGFGLSEPLYSRALEITLRAKGLTVDREYPCKVFFRGQQVGFYRVDMLVEKRIVVELKATERLPDSAKQQLRCYVNVLGLPLGILLHFEPKPRFYRELGRKTVSKGMF
jgi:GxxExxY protein